MDFRHLRWCLNRLLSARFTIWSIKQAVGPVRPAQLREPQTRTLWQGVL